MRPAPDASSPKCTTIPLDPAAYLNRLEAGHICDLRRRVPDGASIDHDAEKCRGDAADGFERD
jgi:hypothetical protein